MEAFEKELTRIKDLLRDNPKGIKITKIAREIGVNRNSVAKYLDILLMTGQLEMRQHGMSKIYFLSKRVGISTMLSLSSDFILVLDKDMKIAQVNDNFLEFSGLKREMVENVRPDSLHLPIVSQPSIFEKIKDAHYGTDIKTETNLIKDGRELFFEIRMTPTVFIDGKPGVTIIISDITERKQNENVLRESEANFRTRFGESPSGFIVFDADGNFVDINAAGLELFGISAGKDIGDLNLFSIPIIPQDSLNTVRKGKKVRFEACLDTDTMDIQYRNSVKRTGKIHLDIQIAPIALKSGLLPGFLVQLHDITDRKLAELSREEYRELLEKTLASLNEAIILVDYRTGRISEVNATATKLFGYSKAEFIGQESRILFTSAKDADHHKAEAFEAFNTAGCYQAEISVLGKEGNVFPVEYFVRPIYDNSGNLDKMVSVFRDLSERYKTEESRRRSEERYRTLAEASRDLIFIFNPNDRIEYVNEFAAEKFNRRPEELAGKTRADLFPAYIADLQNLVAKKVLGSGEPKRIEEKLLFGEKEIWVDTLYTPLKKPDGTIYAVMVVSRDMSEYKWIQAKLRENSERLKSIFEGSPVGMLLFDPDKKRILANGTVKRIFGIPESAKMRDMFNFFNNPNVPPDLDDRLKNHEQVLYEMVYDFSLAQEPVSYERQKEGIIRLEIQITPLVSEAETTINSILVVVQDITDRKPGKPMPSRAH